MVSVIASSMRISVVRALHKNGGQWTFAWHTSAAATLDIYSHVLPSMQYDAAARLKRH